MCIECGKTVKWNLYESIRHSCEQAHVTFNSVCREIIVSALTIVSYDKVWGRNKAERWLRLVCVRFFIANITQPDTISHDTIREQPFNFKEGGGLWFFVLIWNFFLNSWAHFYFFFKCNQTKLFFFLPSQNIIFFFSALYKGVS